MNYILSEPRRPAATAAKSHPYGAAAEADASKPDESAAASKPLPPASTLLIPRDPPSIVIPAFVVVIRRLCYVPYFVHTHEIKVTLT